LSELLDIDLASIKQESILLRHLVGHPRVISTLRWLIRAMELVLEGGIAESVPTLANGWTDNARTSIHRSIVDKARSDPAAPFSGSSQGH